MKAKQAAVESSYRNLGRQTLLWASDVWPPLNAVTGSDLSIQGKVVATFPLKIRQAQKQQGYLKSKITSDVAVALTAIVLRLER